MAKGVLNKKGSIMQIPLSPEGATELGLCPCEGCCIAKTEFSIRGKEHDCVEDCYWWKKYWNK